MAVNSFLYNQTHLLRVEAQKAKSTALDQTIPSFKQLRLKLMAEQAIFLVDEYQTQWTEEHVEKKNHLKINQTGFRNHFSNHRLKLNCDYK